MTAVSSLYFTCPPPQPPPQKAHWAQFGISQVGHNTVTNDPEIFISNLNSKGLDDSPGHSLLSAWCLSVVPPYQQLLPQLPQKWKRGRCRVEQGQLNFSTRMGYISLLLTFHWPKHVVRPLSISRGWESTILRYLGGEETNTGGQ